MLPLLLRSLLLLSLLFARLGLAQVPAWQTAITTANQSFASNSVVHATATDAAGNVYLAGSFSGTVAFGGTVLTSSGPYNTFVAKWNPTDGRFVWVQQGLTPSADYSAATALAVQGSSVYVAGSFTGATLRFGNVALTNTEPQYSDVYVLKLNDLGNAAGVAWAWQAGGPRQEEALSLALSGSQLYVAGSYSAGAAFGGTVPPNRGSVDAFVVRLTDTDGGARFDWVQTAGGASTDVAQALVANGNALYVSGFFYGVAVFGSSTLRSAGEADAYVARLTDAGPSASFDWVRQAGGSGLEVGQGLALANGSLYLAGVTQSSVVVFGSVMLTTTAAPSGFVARLPVDGNPAFAWAVGMGGLPMAVQASGGQVYVAGYFGTGTLPPVMSAASFGSSTLTSYGAYDAFVAGLRDEGGRGSIRWALQAGGSENDEAYTLTRIGARVYVGGVFNGSVMRAGSFLLTQVPISTAALFLASLTDQALPVQGAGALPELACYPNPAHQTATVRVPAAGGPARLTLRDALGRVVRTATAAAGQDYPLELVGLAPGVYAVQVQLGGELATRRLVVE